MPQETSCQSGTVERAHTTPMSKPWLGETFSVAAEEDVSRS